MVISVITNHYILLFRFDVSGVHPKSKTPGTLTQVAYDKKSINDIVSSLVHTVQQCRDGTHCD